MKKRLLTVLCLIFCVLITATACKNTNTECFITGNLKFAKDMNISKMSDYEKDGVKIYETYADNYVFSFIIDCSKVKDFSGTIYFQDKNGEIKYAKTGTLGNNRVVEEYPDYQPGDKIVIKGNNSEIKINIDDFFPGITATEEVKYTSSSSFVYNEKNYKVTDIIKTSGYYIVNFDKKGDDPKNLEPTVYDNNLDKKSGYFINDYKMYITDFLNVENCFYFKFDDSTNVFPIEMNKVS